MQKKIVIATLHEHNIKMAESLGEELKGHGIQIISQKEELSLKNLSKIEPQYIFFPHWSWIIPKEIWSQFECVVFHMTDLPYGRGGTPLQNLIIRGHTDTKISALKVDGGIDSGDIYLKKDLSLEGTAREIYTRSSETIKKMIIEIIKTNPVPQKQKGKIVEFKRRTVEDCEIPQGLLPKQVYDFIRMLDADGYPRAFLEHEGMRFEFENAKLKEDKITSNVQITFLKNEK